MIDLSPDAKQVLSDMYDTFWANISNKGGYRSVWDYVMNVKNNTRYDMFFSSAAKYLPQKIVFELLEKKCIRESKDVDEYVLTSEGLYYTELFRGVDTIDEILSTIDERYFKIEVKNISQRDKVLLFSMVMVRCFAESCCIDARKDDSIKDYWMEIFIKAQDELKKLGIIDKMEIEKLGKSGIEHPMSNLIRHTDDLDTKVKMLYKKTGKNQYYLDMVYPDGTINITNLSYIFGVIFGDKLDYSMIDEVSEFCNESAHTDSIYVLDVGANNYIDVDYDDEIMKALNDCLLNRTRKC